MRRHACSRHHPVQHLRFLLTHAPRQEARWHMVFLSRLPRPQRIDDQRQISDSGGRQTPGRTQKCLFLHKTGPSFQLSLSADA